MMLSDRFQKVITELGMAALEHPLFYHAPVGIRFEIGGEEPVYLDTEPYRPNPAYINDALKRAGIIYEKLPEPPNLLRIDSCPDEEDEDTLVSTICRRAGLPAPHQQKIKAAALPDQRPFRQLQLYWDLSELEFCPERLLREIILGDIGGWPGFVSSVYLSGPGPILYHLYDDRGLDILGGTRELLLPLYHRFGGWILDYDRERIDRIFSEAE